MTRRSTSTVTVLSILSLVTRPVRTRRGMENGLLNLRRGLRRIAFVLCLHCLDPRDLAPRLLYPAQAFVLASGALEAQIELLLAQLQQQCAELVRRLRAYVADLVQHGFGHLRRLRYA